MNHPKPLAVIDTNVFVEIHSCHDLRRDFERLHAKLGNAAIEHPDITLRMQRARESAVLAMYFHSIGAHTYSLRGEAIDMLQQLAPPAPGGTSMDSDFTMVFAHFVLDYVLNDWKSIADEVPETVSDDAADLLLIDYAKANDLPIITAEGYTRDGIVDDNKKRNMRARCKAAGVSVYAPREFYAGKIEPDEAIERFLERFAARVPEWLAVRGKNDKMGEVLRWIFGYYRMILRGEVEGQDEPITTRLF